jgi:integrase/recombinase XerD
MRTYLKQFKSHLMHSKLSTATVQSYVYMIKKLCAKHPNAHELNATQILDYLYEYTNRTKRPNTTLIQSALKRYYTFLYRESIITENPMLRLNIIQRQKPVIHNDLLTTTELQNLYKRCERYAILKIRNQLIVSLLITQGLRLSELIRLKIHDISPDYETIYIRKQRHTLGRKLRLTYKQKGLLVEYIELSAQFRNERNNHSLLFNKLGNVLTADDVQHLLSNYRLTFGGKRITTNLIRQSVISNWINVHNLPVEQVQLLAGHKHISSTIVYQRANIQALLSQVDSYHAIV